MVRMTELVFFHDGKLLGGPGLTGIWMGKNLKERLVIWKRGSEPMGMECVRGAAWWWWYVLGKWKERNEVVESCFSWSTPALLNQPCQLPYPKILSFTTHVLFFPLASMPSCQVWEPFLTSENGDSHKTWSSLALWCRPIMQATRKAVVGGL